MKIILLTLLVSALVALILGFLLGFFKKIFHVEVDETVAKIRSCLPGANCGGCGYPGCDGFAAACAKGQAPVNGCSAGGAEVAKKVGQIMGVSAESVPKAAYIGCRGTKDVALARGKYTGVKTCKAAKLAINGTKFCNWACIGFGDCVQACNFNAIKIGDDGLPHVNKKLCTGCGSCSRACPQKVISINNAELKGVIVQCSNRNPVKAQIMKLCKNGCIKCGKCERTCENDALHLVDGLPVIDYTKCTACGKCAEGCPTKVLTLA
ncbi:MAG: RnfABCDGE type electron transport complex subunit B [Treponemataceae bacterium]|nr:RnfABCDGE type electron transport complex subunit B [Treponemataceae bacterium]